MWLGVYNKKKKNIFYIIDKIELIFRVPYNIILYVKWGRLWYNLFGSAREIFA